MLKSYRVVVVAHVILMSAQVLWVLTYDFGLRLDNKILKTLLILTFLLLHKLAFEQNIYSLTQSFSQS